MSKRVSKSKASKVSNGQLTLSGYLVTKNSTKNQQIKEEKTSAVSEVSEDDPSTATEVQLDMSKRVSKSKASKVSNGQLTLSGYLVTKNSTKNQRIKEEKTSAVSEVSDDDPSTATDKEYKYEKRVRVFPEAPPSSSLDSDITTSTTFKYFDSSQPLRGFRISIVGKVGPTHDQLKEKIVKLGGSVVPETKSLPRTTICISTKTEIDKGNTPIKKVEICNVPVVNLEFLNDASKGGDPLSMIDPHTISSWSVPAFSNICEQVENCRQTEKYGKTTVKRGPIVDQNSDDSVDKRDGPGTEINPHPTTSTELSPLHQPSAPNSTVSHTEPPSTSLVADTDSNPSCYDAVSRTEPTSTSSVADTDHTHSNRNDIPMNIPTPYGQLTIPPALQNRFFRWCENYPVHVSLGVIGVVICFLACKKWFK